MHIKFYKVLFHGLSREKAAKFATDLILVTIELVSTGRLRHMGKPILGVFEYCKEGDFG